MATIAELAQMSANVYAGTASAVQDTGSGGKLLAEHVRKLRGVHAD